MLAAQDYPHCGFIVVDQTEGRDFQLEKQIESLGTRFKYIRMEKPNLPAARNVGIRNASGELILFIDDDVVLGHDFVSLHARAHREGRNVGAVTGLVLDTDRPIEESFEWCRRAFGVPDVKGGGVFEVSWAFGGNTSYLRSALMDAGLFDEHFRGCAIGEDNDLSERVKRKGYRLLLDTRIQMQHLHLSSGGCEVRNVIEQKRVYVEHFELNLYRFMKRFAMRPSFQSAYIVLTTLRTFSLSRSLLRQGIRAVIQREVECVGIVARVVKAVCVSLWSTQRLRAGQ
jgi:GT2 family glycosyltransferase